MTTEKPKPISITFCVKCDVATRPSTKDADPFINQLKSLLQQGYVKQMTWSDCQSHKPDEQGTKVTAYLLWEEIIKRR